jgi:hypothetical protein
MAFPWDIVDRVAARLAGPFSFRFVLQPIVAIVLGVRDGIRDGRQGTQSFLLDFLGNPHSRKPHLQQALRRLFLPPTVAIILDGLVQFLLFGWVRVSGAVTAGPVLMGLPYIIARAVTNWIVFRRTAQMPVEPE